MIIRKMLRQRFTNLDILDLRGDSQAALPPGVESSCPSIGSFVNAQMSALARKIVGRRYPVSRAPVLHFIGNQLSV
jgi:hypothetical protein